MRLSRIGIFTSCVLAVAICWFAYPATTFGFEIQIDVAPNVLNLESEGTVVTVHTDIAYSLVVGSTVFLNGVPIHHWKADARGNFVAKFLSDEIKTLEGLRIDDYNALKLTGYTTDDEAFIGAQEIKVIEIIPKGQ